jgi:hypothetical protein
MLSLSDAVGGAAPPKCLVVPLPVRPTPCKFQMAVRPVAHNCLPLSRPYNRSKTSTLHIISPAIVSLTLSAQSQPHTPSCSLLLAKSTYRFVANYFVNVCPAYRCTSVLDCSASYQLHHVVLAAQPSAPGSFPHPCGAYKASFSLKIGSACLQAGDAAS